MRHLIDKILDRIAAAVFVRIRHRLLAEPAVWGDEARLHVSDSAQLNDCLINTVSGEVHIADYVMCGHGVQLVTGVHPVEQFGPDREQFPESGRDIVVGEGVWIGSRAVVLGPCRIGAHSVVGAGAVVVDDVEPFTVVGGVPARLIRRLDSPDPLP